jgi:hypothetical protein
VLKRRDRHSISKSGLRKFGVSANGIKGDFYSSEILNRRRDWRQQISAEITALQSAHQELQRSSVKVISWYSEPNALLQSAGSKKTKT